MSSLAQQSLHDLGQQLAARSPAPGGGAAAALVAALAVALGAMAARYSSGKRYAAVAAEARALAEEMDRMRGELLAIADADALAYARVQDLRREEASPDLIQQAEAAARQVPADLIAQCHEQALALQNFIPRCNPWLLSDLRAALHLLSGAGAAGWEILLAGDPPLEQRQESWALIQQLRQISDHACSPVSQDAAL